MKSSCILLVAAMLNYYLFGGAAQSVCSRGARLLYVTRDQSDLCVPCEVSTFMDEDSHSHTECKTCMFIEDPDVEVFDSLCNKTHDSVILCKDGFYRRRARNDRQTDRCEECTYCPHPTRACQGYQDTVCCHPNQDAVMTSSGVFVCEERPVVCGPGQLFSISNKECLPCPSWSTYMKEDNHSHTTCKTCTLIEDPDVEVLISLCNKTHDSVILCTSGFYRRRAGNDGEVDSCEECTQCAHPYQACQDYNDTLCCHPNQDTVMTSSGVFVCEERPVVCGPGQFFSTSTKECFPCPSWDTFMTEDSHSHTACNICTLIEDPDVEVLSSLCNKTHDSVILCSNGFYRRRGRNGGEVDRCEKCTYCPHPTRACQGYQNTVCCHPNQDAVMTSSGVFVCQERPVVCGPGQFFNTSTKECLPCPAGTFMSAHNHTYKVCLKCEQLSENIATHAINTRPCSRTAPTLFGCEDGYFRDPTQESLQTEVPCTPCRSCHRHLVDCGMFHDTICDLKEEITAVNSSASDTTNDAENSVKGKIPFTDTFGSGLNATTEAQNRAQFYSVTLVTCVTLIIILMSALYDFLSNLKHKQLYECTRSQILRKILKNHHGLSFCTIVVMLFASLIFCIFSTTGTIKVPNVFYEVVVSMTVIATGVFIIVVINGHACSCRQTNKSRDDNNEDESLLNL